MKINISLSILIPLIISAAILILLGILVICIIKYNQNKKIKFIRTICSEIESCLEDKIITLKYQTKAPYNIFIETQYNICYVKVYKITNSKILKIDLNNDFYLLTSPTDSNPLKMNIDDFLNIKSINTKKRTRKVIIFYPSLQEKIAYKSKYNIEFIKKEEENKGCNILSGYEIRDYFKNFEIFDYTND